MSHILVLNCGSSSVKFALINPITKQEFFSGLAENIAQPNCQVTFKSTTKVEKHIKNGTYRDVFNELKNYLVDNGYLSSIVAIGHRVVAGGNYFSSSVVITIDNLQKIKNCIPACTVA